MLQLAAYGIVCSERVPGYIVLKNKNTKRGKHSEKNGVLPKYEGKQQKKEK
jgi:hypothetical protein